MARKTGVRSFPMGDEEWALVVSAAAAAGVSASEWLREAARLRLAVPPKKPTPLPERLTFSKALDGTPRVRVPWCPRCGGAHDDLPVIPLAPFTGRAACPAGYGPVLIVADK